MARPEKPFNWDLVDELASLGASENYVAEKLIKWEIQELEIKKEVNGKTVESMVRRLNRRIKKAWKLSYVQFRDKKQDDWRIELIGLQKEKARTGNPTMLIWLGKQYLGQTDKVETEQNSNITVNYTVKEKPTTKEKDNDYAGFKK